MSKLKATNLYKSYGNNKVLRGINLSIGHGEILALIGRNAQGKSTLGRLLVQLESPDTGSITLPFHNSKKGQSAPMLVPQDFVVWPHLTTATNVYYGTRGPKKQRKDTTHRWLKSFALDCVQDQLAGTLSHGQQQRLALARAFAFHPSLIVLDETFTHLDVLLRRGLIDETAAHCRAEKLTTLWITHDNEEAFAVADRIAVIEGGRIVQIDTPEQLYRNPQNAFVAQLTGHGTLLKPEEWKQFCQHLSSPHGPPSYFQKKNTAQSTRFLRPEHLKIHATNNTPNSRFRIQSRQFAGDRYLYKIRCENLPSLLAYSDSNSRPLESDTPVTVELCTTPCPISDLS